MQNLLLSIIVLLNYNFVINKNMEKDNTQQMLNEQIIASGVKDNSIIINAMSNVSRKDFIVPFLVKTPGFSRERLQSLCYNFTVLVISDTV
jgi:hypothetical protein